MAVTVVVLAAGESKRFGSQKLLHQLDRNDNLLARAIRASSGFNAVVVCSDATLAPAQALGAHTVINREPKRGMIHSLRLANDAIASKDAILVLPADLLRIEPHHLTGFAALANDGDDVLFPVRADGTPGHPVYFSARARALIGRLAEGEPIAHLRDNAALSRRAVVVDEPWPFQDVDEPSDLR
ncbi:MAG TPA: NTP transferase domain-containing protein [Candidatus Aquilonibacter sp.]